MDDNGAQFAVDIQNMTGSPAKLCQSPLVKVLCIALIVCLVIAIIFIILFAVEVNKAKPNESGGSKVCNTNNCLQVALRMTSWMDTSVDPCQDFFQFACGANLKKYKLSAAQPFTSTSGERRKQNLHEVKSLLEKVKMSPKSNPDDATIKAVRFYLSCRNTTAIDEKGVSPLQDLIKECNSWPVTDSKFNASTWDMLGTYVKLHRNLLVMPIFLVAVAPDILNAVNNIIVFDQVILNLPRKVYLVNALHYESMRQIYKGTIRSILISLGASALTANITADKIFSFEKKIAMVLMSAELRQNRKAIYEKLTLEEFCKKTVISLPKMMRVLSGIFNQTIPKSEIIGSYSSTAIKMVHKYYKQQSTEFQATWVIWKLVTEYGKYIGGKFGESVNSIPRIVTGVLKPVNWAKCTAEIVNAFPLPTGRLYTDATFTKAEKDDVEEIIQYVRESFVKNIKETTWMDAKTRQYAVEKATLMGQAVGYPDNIQNEEAVNSEYKTIHVDENKYFANNVNIRKVAAAGNYALRGTKVDRTRFKMAPSAANAYHDFSENKIVFLAGILQPPFYDQRAPRSVKFGSTGMFVGHEITHGYDTTGRQFDKDGSMNNWWTKESLEYFEKRATCFVNQYSNFSAYGLKLNGNLTLTENIADDGGLKNGLRAYREWVKKHGNDETLPGLNLNPEQLFFLAFGQTWCAKYTKRIARYLILTNTHTLEEFRVKGTLQNSEDFAKAFKCASETQMNPKDKCSLW